MTSNWFRSLGQLFASNRAPRRKLKRRRRVWQYEALEPRSMLSVNFSAPLGNTFNLDSGHDLFIPLSAADVGNSITFSVTNNTNSSMTTQVISSDYTSTATNPTIDINISGDGFTNKDIKFEFLGTLAPQTVAHYVSLINAGTYSTASFYRVITALSGEGTFRLAQGGVAATGTGSPVGTDEFSKSFNSPGILAGANTGAPNSTTSEFFVTDPTASYSLSQDTTLETALDNKYDAFGQMVSGFDVFQQLISTPVVNQTTSPNEHSKPATAVTINSISIINDSHPQTAVLKISNPSSVAGPVKITVQASGSSTATQVFTINTVANNQPILAPVKNLITPTNTPVTFTMSTVNSVTSPTFIVTDPNNFGNAPSNVTVSTIGSDGKVTLTPANNFTGTITLLAGVRDNTQRATDSTGALLPLTAQGNFYTQRFTLTVGGTISGQPTGTALSTPESSGNTQNYVVNDNQGLSVTAPTGSTVQFFANNMLLGTATESPSGSGTFTLAGSSVTGKLQLGNNSVQAVVTNNPSNTSNETSGALFTVVFAPSFQQSYIAPGIPGSGLVDTIASIWSSRQAAFNNELGYYIANANGSVNFTSAGGFSGSGTIAVGAAATSTLPSYANAVIQAAVNGSSGFGGIKGGILFTSGTSANPHAPVNLSLSPGQTIGFFLIQNSTAANFLANNKNNSSTGGPLAFFSFDHANPDGLRHVHTIADSFGGTMQLRWEDETGAGDKDFNDAVLNFSVSTIAMPVAPPIRVAGPTGTTTSTSFDYSGPALVAGQSFGIFNVDNAQGKIGSLSPGDSGYTAAALASGNSQAIFTGGSGFSTHNQPNLNAGQLIAFYYTTGSTTFYLFPAANSDGATHFLWAAPETKADSSSTTPSTADTWTLHAMTTPNGTLSNFDAFTVKIAFPSFPPYP